MKKMETFYARFGENVIGVVKAKAKPDGDINHLLKNLGLPLSGVLDRQHRTLVEFIQRYGRDTFMKAIALPGGAIAVRRLLQELELEKVLEKREQERRRAEVMSGRNPFNVITPIPLNPNAAPTPVPEEVPPGWFRTADYFGPDRRTRGERRSSPADRRQSVEIITFKNRRFGPKRRQGERRGGGQK